MLMGEFDMPEKMTEQEARISRAIRLVRKAKETIKLVGSSEEIPYDSEGEEVKVKRPKAEKADKIKNQTQKKEGYGLAGEVIGKAVDVSIDSMFEDVIEEIASVVEQGEDSKVAQEQNMRQVKTILNEFKRRLVTYLKHSQDK
tara:strand:- start:742 stop:1170 length:429 start_codon:yes stop_codon:yes gene_type:complete